MLWIPHLTGKGWLRDVSCLPASDLIFVGKVRPRATTNDNFKLDSDRLTGYSESAGLNRHAVGDARALRERSKRLYPGL